MNVRDFKKLLDGYNDMLPVEHVFTDLFFKQFLSYQTISNCYTSALERERIKHKTRFYEACVCLTQYLCGNFRKKKEKEQVDKRSIHIFNLAESFPAHVHDEKYGYTKEDEKEWDMFCERMYGRDFNDK